MTPAQAAKAAITYLKYAEIALRMEPPQPMTVLGAITEARGALTQALTTEEKTA